MLCKIVWPLLFVCEFRGGLLPTFPGVQGVPNVTEIQKQQQIIWSKLFTTSSIGGYVMYISMTVLLLPSK